MSALRDDHGRINPIFPVNGFFPISPCPHGRRLDLHDYCPKCEKLHPVDQRAVDRSNPPAPTDPETRIRQIQSYLDSGLLEFDQQCRMNAEIKRLQSVVDTWAGTPTKYVPHPTLKPGIGK